MTNEMIRPCGDQTALSRISGHVKTPSSECHTCPNHQEKRRDLRSNDKKGRRKQILRRRQNEQSSHHPEISDNGQRLEHVSFWPSLVRHTAICMGHHALCASAGHQTCLIHSILPGTLHAS